MVFYPILTGTIDLRLPYGFCSLSYSVAQALSHGSIAMQKHHGQDNT